VARRAGTERVLTYQAREERDVLLAQAYPVRRAALVKVFEDLLLARKVFVRSSGRPAKHYAKLLEGLGYHPTTARTLVALDGEEFVTVAARGEDRFERRATYEFFDASLRAKKKDADPAQELAPALGTECDFVVYRDTYVRLKTRSAARGAELLSGLLDRFLRANAAPRTPPLPAGVAAQIDKLSEAVGLSLAPESIHLTDDALTIALWRGRLRVHGVEAPPFVSQANERADLRFDRRAEIWQLSESFRAAECPLGPYGYSREWLVAGLTHGEAARRTEAFERLAPTGDPAQAPEADRDAVLLALATEHDPEVRAAGLVALRAFGDEAAREPLVRALGDDATIVREAAAEALAGAEALANDPRVRPEVERLLIKVEDEDEAGALLALYERVLPAGRVAFLEGLAALRPPRFLAPIVEATGGVGGQPGEDRARAWAFVKRHAASKREDVLEAVRAARAKMRRKASPDLSAP
jgi:hypothetical protein